MGAQLGLGLAVEQRRRVTPEPAELHAAVMVLRRCGRTVHRAGDRAAMVDGVVRSNAWVMRKARGYVRDAKLGQ